MDPNTVLAKMRQLATDMHGWEEGDEDPDEPGEYYRIASEMVEAFDALDGWLAVRTIDLERRAYRLRSALREAGVPENLVRAIELGGENPQEGTST
jgi:hypothetical protein